MTLKTKKIRPLASPPRLCACKGPNDCAKAMKVLSDATRLHIVRILIGGPLNVSSLAKATGLSQPRVSHHLARMRSAGLLIRERDGRRIIYKIDPHIAADKSLDFGCCQIIFRSIH